MAVAEEKIMLIDGNSLLYRAFYALPMLTTTAGEYTNGVYGFLNMYRRLLAEQDPSHVLVAFDRERKNFRNEIYPEYKANRSSPPDELRPQFALLRETLDAMNIKWLEMSGYEGDDIIGCFSELAARQGMAAVIVTGDRDALQLISENTHVCLTKKGISDIEHYDVAAVKEKWGITPAQMLEVKALMGDCSDNIPGVSGVGEKTALKLVREYGALEGIYEHLEEIGGKKLKENLAACRETAFLSRELGRIVTDIPEQPRDLEPFRRQAADVEQLRRLYSRLEFKGMLQALDSAPASEESGAAPEPASAPPSRIINRRQDAEAFLAALPAEGAVVIAVESDYHHPMWANLQRILIEGKDEIGVFEQQGLFSESLEWLRPLLEDADRPKYMHNAKAAEILLRRQGIALRGVQQDMMLLAYVLDPALPADDLPALLKARERITLNKGDSLSAMACIYPQTERMLAELAPEQEILYKEMELPLSSVLADMEYQGVRVEREVLEQISEELKRHLAADAALIYDMAGETFNINSPQQLGRILFEKLGLNTGKKTKTGYSTDQKVLEALYGEHEIIAHIMNYRQLAKLQSTYAEALPKLIHPETGRVHTIFRQTGTVTGRLSSTEPNLQNIPIRVEEGRRLRRAFTVSTPQRILFSADYSQIDLRSLAHISGDEILIDTFNQGVDIHTRTAAEIFGVPLSAVKDELRRRAKAVNFGIVYGISDFGLARSAGVSRAEAKSYIENYLDSYPGVRNYMENIVEFGRQHGYVETIFNRRRYLPDLNAKNRNLQAFARRMAYNTPVQGTSADIIKLAMLRLHEEIARQGLKSRMLLQVHDELVFEAEKDELNALAVVVKNCMENTCQLKVPLEVTMKQGDNWYDMREYVV
ncbi:MAG: DNA polymerase I [Syntrophomonadaceae bacterium]|nr:DNA polymerase I [Syntrophomonadaceae bacterium]